MLWELPSLKNEIHSLEDVSSKSEWSYLKFAIVSIVDFYDDEFYGKKDFK